MGGLPPWCVGAIRIFSCRRGLLPTSPFFPRFSSSLRASCFLFLVPLPPPLHCPLPPPPLPLVPAPTPACVPAVHLTTLYLDCGPETSGYCFAHRTVLLKVNHEPVTVTLPMAGTRPLRCAPRTPAKGEQHEKRHSAVRGGAGRSSAEQAARNVVSVIGVCKC